VSGALTRNYCDRPATRPANGTHNRPAGHQTPPARPRSLRTRRDWWGRAGSANALRRKASTGSTSPHQGIRFRRVGLGYRRGLATLFNHANFGAYNGVINTATFGNRSRTAPCSRPVGARGPSRLLASGGTAGPRRRRGPAFARSARPDGECKGIMERRMKEPAADVGPEFVGAAPSRLSGGARFGGLPAQPDARKVEESIYALGVRPLPARPPPSGARACRPRSCGPWRSQRVRGCELLGAAGRRGG
jgi:hypothetical protein